MLTVTKHLIIAGALALATIQPVATYAQSIIGSRVGTVAQQPTQSTSAYTAALHEVRDRLNFLEGLLLDAGRDVNIVVYAEHDVKCPGGKTFSLSTPNGGSCKTVFDAEGNTQGGVCEDKEKGDSALVNCHKDRGAGACVSTAGEGKCQIKQ